MTRHNTMAGQRRDHYSYTVYEEDSVTRGFDAARFSGDVGRYMAQHQATFMMKQIGCPEGLTILDLGAGTGRTSLPLGQSGARVVAADASIKMLNILGEKAFLQGADVVLSRIDAHDLPFADRVFDVVLSFRMIMHVVNWRRALSEACRVTKNLIILDFPPKCGFAGLAPLIHPIIRPFNRNHQSYRVFSVQEVVSALDHEGFDVLAVDRHLVLPFGLHRFVNSLKITRYTESFLQKIGLRDVFGAPVTIAAHRRTGNA
jgi:ubiquinone/menaquinone biosynthesis C-methylase UbiE